MSKRTVFLLSIALLLLAVAGGKTLEVKGDSMFPTLVEGQRLYINSGLPSRGELAVIIEPDSGVKAVKRCIGVPGDRILISDGAVYINEERFSRLASVVTDLSPVDVDIKYSAATSTAAANPKEIYPLEISSKKGHGVELNATLFSREASAAVKIRRGALIFSLKILAEPNTWEVSVVGGKLMKARVLKSGDLKGEPTKAHKLFISLANDQCNASIDGQQVIEPLLVSAFSKHQPPEIIINEGVSIELEGECKYSSLRIGCEINYQVAGNFGLKEVFQLGSDEYYLLGDNSSRSRDSRHYGAIPRQQILGVATRIWPRSFNTNGWPLE